MSRKPHRERAGYADFVSIVCHCGKRLALKDETLPGVVDGPDFVQSDAKGFDPSGGLGGWFRLLCPRCGRDNRVKESELLRLVRGARARDAKRVTLVSATDQRR